MESAKSDAGHVKGTLQPFPVDGPSCKYAAIFDTRPAFDALRLAFLLHADPHLQIETAMGALASVIAADDAEPALLAGAFAFYEQMQRWSQRNMPMCDPPDFSTRAWGAYLKCIQRTDYYFSVEELLVVCARARVNVSVFKQIGTRLQFAGGCFAGV